jgi:hypothetical protein
MLACVLLNAGELFLIKMSNNDVTNKGANLMFVVVVAFLVASFF